MLDESAIKAIAHLDADGVGKSVETQDGRERVFSPPGWSERVIDPVDAPLSGHIRQSVRLDDAVSFAAYVNAFKTGRTRLFVSVANHSMRAVFDYHGAAQGEKPGASDYLHHSAAYEMPFSEEWARWTRIDGVALPQMKFAEFLEENLGDIVEPSGASVLESALNLQARKKVQFDSGVRLQDGTTQLTYREETEGAGKGTLVVPTEFTIAIPVLFGGDLYKVKAFLRYRIEEGKLTFHIALHRRQFVLQDAVRETAKTVGDTTGILPLFGAVG